jgi:uncharacterized membrane protein
MNSLLIRLAIAVSLASAASAMGGAVTFEFVAPRGYAGTDVSADGSVVVGNIVGDGSFETFRWTQPGGAVRLGRPTVPVLGTGAGSPDVSWDGDRVSATILGDDNFANMGVWENGAWTWPTQLPPDAMVIDNNRSDAWGLSGDGDVAVGLYWKTQPGGSARGLSWNLGNPGVALPSSGVNPQSSRANAANYDGTVIVGWQDYNGPWQPAVWRNGVQTILSPTPVRCEARATSGDGSVIVGNNYNATFDRREAAMWVFQGGQYVEQTLGVVTGTPQSFQAHVWAQDVSADGSIIVGTNRFFENGPFSDGTGFIWTASTGMVDVVTFLADNGIVLDPLFDIQELTAISADGSTILGLGRWTDTFELATFRVTVPEPAALGVLAMMLPLLRPRRRYPISAKRS